MKPNSPRKNKTDSLTKKPTKQEARLAQVREFYELASITPLVQGNYPLSRVWAWICRIRVSPYISVPIPRFFTQRDP